MKLISLIALTCLLTGCVTGKNKGWQGIAPGKDVQVDELSDEITTPWGYRKFTAKGVRSRNNPTGDNPLPQPMESPKPQTTETGTITVPLELGVTVRQPK